MPEEKTGAEARSFLIAGTLMTAPRQPPGLYIVATPIGNLGDITLRALQVLAGVDGIYCEDTRVSARLMQHYGIHGRLKPYHDHNAAQERPKILEKLRSGAALALISDAGTPLISDPGYKLVETVREAGLPVTAAPGASAVLTALTIAGLPTDGFFFAGFLPVRQEARKKRLTELRSVPGSLIFFESGPRIAESLAACAAILGGRPAAICRELTKLHEEVRRGLLPDLAHHYAGDAEIRGEFVIVIGPPVEEALDEDRLDDLILAALKTATVKEASDELAVVTGLPRRKIYQRALELKAPPA